MPETSVYVNPDSGWKTTTVTEDDGSRSVLTEDAKGKAVAVVEYDSAGVDVKRILCR